MTIERLVVIGASSGGIDALRELAGGLPSGFPAPIGVVLHLAPDTIGLLPEILSRAGPLPAVNARNLERLEPGRIYVAPPDQHLLVEPGRLRLARGPRENRFRPAIDPLFRSAAQVYGPAAIGVILTGNLDDGVDGLRTIKRLGGVAVVQHPEDATYPSMPLNAMRHVDVDYAVPLAGMPDLLTRLASTPAHERPVGAAHEGLAIELAIAREEDPREAGVLSLGGASMFTCPECGGVLLQVMNPGLPRFRCHAGHAYSVASLLSALREKAEDSISSALRTSQETAMLMREMAAHLKTHRESRAAAEEALAAADEQDRHAERLRRMLSESGSPRAQHPV